MLHALSIQNVVLIDRLDITFKAGLTALTGETGAGKSIILDALGLAIGARAAKSLVRSGCDEARVSASFALAEEHPAHRIAAAADIRIEPGEDLVLRRILGADGRSRALVNDQPVSAALLRDIGASLVEVHGQNDGHGLLDAARHQPMLDSYGGLQKQAALVAARWQALKEARAHEADLRERTQRAAQESEYLRLAVDDLERLDPKAGEDEALGAQRNFLMQAEKTLADVEIARAALQDDNGLDSRLSSALRALETTLARLQDTEGAEAVAVPLARGVQALEKALIEAEEAAQGIEDAAQALQIEPGQLDQLEERLFALRAAARKHDVAVDDLAAVRVELTQKLEAIDNLDRDLEVAQNALAAARTAYSEAAQKLTAKRQTAAKRLEKTVAGEFIPLKMEKARFRVHRDTRGEAHWGPSGQDQIAFEISTNPGTPFGPLAVIASGGELSRFSLALKAALAAREGAAVLIFDEIDQGVGGAVADAVGRRIAALAKTAQVLVVTHSPQVAARAQTQIQITKSQSGKTVLTRLHVLDESERTEEIARMLAGAKVTDEARAAARALIDVG